MDKESKLPRKARGILFNFKKELQSKQDQLHKIIFEIFNVQKTIFKHSQFQDFVKQIDFLLPFQDVDYLWSQLKNVDNTLQVSDLFNIIKSINQKDNPFNNDLDNKSQNIIASMKIIPILSEDNKIVLALKDFKDLLNDFDPWVLFDVFDEDRDGCLTRDDLNQILVNYDVSPISIPLIIKGIFSQKKKCTYTQIMKILGLENIRKSVDFNNLIVQNKNNLRLSMNMSMSIKIKPDKEQQQYEKPQVVINNIPKILEPYYTNLTEMTQPLFSLASQKLEFKQIYLDFQNPKSSKAVDWEYPSNIFNSDYNLFQKGSIVERSKVRVGMGQFINANQINQGQMGNCYFMSAISSIAEFYPQFIFKLFVLDKNPSQIYGVRLFVDGRWQTIILDARFPVNKNQQLIYGKPKNTQIWSILLEKAWAKLYKSYENIGSGTSSEGLTSITGAPCITLQNNEDLKVKIEEAIKNGYVINCSGSNYLEKQTQQWQQNAGLYAGHAYSIINLHTNLSWRGQILTLIKLRNPWGKKAWQYNWSFNSSKWTTQLRNKLNYHKDPNDGTFYMCFDDFQTCFDKPTICHINPNNFNSSITLTTNRTHSTMVSFNIKQPRKYYFSLYQQNKRKYNLSGNYELSNSRIYVGKLQNGQIKPICSGTAISNNLHKQQFLEAGEYILSCKIKWKYKQRNSFNLTMYGPESIQLKQIPKDKTFLPKFITAIAKKQDGQKIQYGGDLGKSYRIFKLSVQQGYGYLFLKNCCDKTIEFLIKFSKADNNQAPIGIKFFKPQTSIWKVAIAPNQQVIRCFLTDPKGCNVQLSQQISYKKTNPKFKILK